jgi:hypothetical protein
LRLARELAGGLVDESAHVARVLGELKALVNA